MTTIGVPTEIKQDERRVALTPAGTRELTSRGHRVVVQRGAGAGAGFSDEAYRAAGAECVDVDDVFSTADLIVKVKEPQAPEVDRMSAGQTLFTYLHLAAEPALAAGLQASGACCIAYETVEDRQGRLPLLAPMSEVAGRLAAQAAASSLASIGGGSGILMGGVAGVAPAEILVIGGGVSGTAAATVAAGMGARVTVVDRSVVRLGELDSIFQGRVRTIHASEIAIEELLPSADVVIGAVLVAGARAPQVVRREQLATMRSGSVLIDISIDQGGCFETSRPTTHTEPTYLVDGIVHYCVTNMPGAVPRTSTRALTNATLEHIIRLADLGTDKALESDPLLAKGLNIRSGRIEHDAVAAALGHEAVLV